MSDIERAAFEQAVTDRWSDSYSFTRFGDEDYYDEVLEGMWQGWQARAKTDACCSEIPNSSGSDSEKPNRSEAVAWSWENHGRQVTVDKAFADELISDGEIVRPLIFGDTHPASRQALSSCSEIPNSSDPDSRQALEGEAIGEVGYMIQPNWDDPSKTKGVALVDKSLAPGTKLYTHPASRQAVSVPDAWCVVTNDDQIQYTAMVDKNLGLPIEQSHDYAWQQCNEVIQEWIELGLDAASKYVIRPIAFEERVAELECMVRAFRACVDLQMVPSWGSPCHNQIHALVVKKTEEGT